jgi:hypothetical protein
MAAEVTGQFPNAESRGVHTHSIPEKTVERHREEQKKNCGW